MSLLRWFLATLPLASLASGQNCYWPNGNTASNLKACSVASSNDAAACCFADHYCMTNGLCLSPTEGTWYRGGCTDEQFQQTGCPQICHTNDIEGGVTSAHVGIFTCGSNRFACLNRSNCAVQNFTVGAYRAVMNAALSTDLFDSSGATATTSITSSTGASTAAAGDPSCTSTQQASNGISTGAAAGIGVGVGVPLAIAVGALTFMLFREKRRSRDAQAGYQRQDGHNQRLEYNRQQPWKPEGYYVPTAEAPGHMVAHELGDTQGRPELDR